MNLADSEELENDQAVDTCTRPIKTRYIVAVAMLAALACIPMGIFLWFRMAPPWVEAPKTPVNLELKRGILTAAMLGDDSQYRLLMKITEAYNKLEADDPREELDPDGDILERLRVLPFKENEYTQKTFAHFEEILELVPLSSHGA